MSKDQKITNNQNVEIVDKVIKERDKLKIKIDKLDKWLQTDKPYVSNKHYMLLLTQYNIMQSYRTILDLRIDDLQKPRNVFTWETNAWKKLK